MNAPPMPHAAQSRSAAFHRSYLGLSMLDSVPHDVVDNEAGNADIGYGVFLGTNQPGPPLGPDPSGSDEWWLKVFVIVVAGVVVGLCVLDVLEVLQ